MTNNNPSNKNESRNRTEEENENYSSSGSNPSRRSGNLSQAAEKMRSGNPEERSEGASELGRSGGHQSHKND